MGSGRHLGRPGANVSRPPDLGGQNLLKLLVLARGVNWWAILKQDRLVRPDSLPAELPEVRSPDARRPWHQVRPDNLPAQESRNCGAESLGQPRGDLSGRYMG